MERNKMKKKKPTSWEHEEESGELLVVFSFSKAFFPIFKHWSKWPVLREFHPKIIKTKSLIWNNSGVSKTWEGVERKNKTTVKAVKPYSGRGYLKLVLQSSKSTPRWAEQDFNTGDALRL